jgi:hypothetical protein
VEFQIDYLNAEATFAKAQKIASRSKKKGLSGGWKVSLETRTEADENGIATDRTYLIVEGTPCVYEGWEFVGVADNIEGQYFNRSIAGATDYKVTQNYCVQCNTDRDRNSLLIVRNTETGDIKQLGSTCVKDFLGWYFSPVALPSIEEFESLGGSGGGKISINTVKFLSYVVAKAEADGYMTSQASVSTGRLVWDGLLGDKVSREDLVEPTEADIAKAEALLAWGKEKFTIVDEGDAYTSYFYNMAQALTFEYVYDQTKGIVASLYKTQQNVIAKEVEEKKVYKTEQFAPTGEKVILDVTVTGENTFESAYGLVTLYQFVSGDYKFKWFSSSGANIEVGQTYKLKGTVKGSEEYKGQFSTTLTRCKVVA